MNKVVLNNCYGGFRLSEEAVSWLRERLPQDVEVDEWGWIGMTRHHPLLVEVVETLGEEANEFVSELVVVEIKDDRYLIEEYDGMESIVTPSTLKPPKWKVIGGE
jgi:hypothetical protein